MTRVVSVFLPTWPTDRFRRRSPAASPSPDQPLVLVGTDGRHRTVLAADGAAQRAGLHGGMPATNAQVLVPGLVIADADPRDDARALERLAYWALRYSPVVAADPPDGIVLDTSGADHLLRGEEPLLRDLLAASTPRASLRGRLLRTAGGGARACTVQGAAVGDCGTWNPAGGYRSPAPSCPAPGPHNGRRTARARIQYCGRPPRPAPRTPCPAERACDRRDTGSSPTPRRVTSSKPRFRTRCAAS